MDIKTITHGIWQRLHDAGKVGDEAAFQALVNRMRARGIAYIDNHIDPLLAGSLEYDDILQEAWIRVLKGLATFEYTTPGDFARWFYRLLGAVMGDERDTLLTAKRQPVDLPPRRQPDPVALADLQDMREKLLEMLPLLNDSERRVIQLRHYGRLSREETAKRLGITPQSVSNLTVRAIESMRRMQ